MIERNSKEHPPVSARVSQADHKFLRAVMEEGSLSKTAVVKGLFRMGRVLGPTAVAEAIRHLTDGVR